jgi:crotonobetainyl-CoA:carnitine CoA-transferase CaiB-like acyl-CoA transferase
VRYDAAPPLLGQHTEEILGERLGFDAAQIVAFRTRGVI